ncbi:RNA polymerase subunit sigma-24 [Bryobacterales bacterium F-183]|nr:RNA polymerase subunit sigma-24 [Bryobacterales bacterium F-183]
MSELLEGLFRESAGSLVSILTRTLGARHLDLAEECVQDALIKAMEKWPFHGIPENPRGWLLQAARNRAIDVLRRERRMVAAPEIVAGLEAMTVAGSGQVDDELGMVFLCCHPALGREAQVALILKTVGGLGVSEIARAYLVADATIAQRLVRAKAKLREVQAEFDLPQAMADVASRIESVMEALYLLYNEGYSICAPEFSEEAIRLARLLVRNPATALPQAHALLSLMLLQSARDGARMSDAGGLVVLRKQDRSLWNRERVTEGVHHLDLAGHGGALTRYHLEAVIASVHASAKRWEDTDWGKICTFYEALEAVHPTPVVRLNRAVAVAQHLGPIAGLDLLDQQVAEELRGYSPYYAVMGHLLEQAGQTDEAANYFLRASEVARTGVERSFFEQRARGNVGDFLRTVTVIH